MKSHLVSQSQDYFGYWSFSEIKGNYCCYRGSEHATPKVWHFGTLNVLSWRNLINSRCGKASPPFFPEAGQKMSCERWPPAYTEERSALISESKWTGLLSVPPFTTLSSYPFCPVKFFHGLSMFIKPSIKTLRFNCLFGFSLS